MNFQTFAKSPVYRLTLAMKADCTNQTFLPVCTKDDDSLCKVELCSIAGVPATCPFTCGLCRKARFKREIEEESPIESEFINDVSPKTVSVFTFRKNITKVLLMLPFACDYN